MSRKEDILAQCIDEIEAGKSTLEDCLSRYPELRHELQPLLQIAQRLQSPKVTPSLEYKLEARSRLFEAMRSSPVPVESRRLVGAGWLRTLILARRPGLVAVAILLLAIISGSTVYASQRSLPDDSLYVVKKGVENIQLALTPGSEARAVLRSQLAQRRVEEVIALSNLRRIIGDPSLQAISAQIDAAIRDISNVPPQETKPFLTQFTLATLNQEIRLSHVLAEAPESSHAQLQQILDVIRRGKLIAKAAYDNPAFLNNLPSVSDDQLEAAYFEIKGTLLSADDGTWNIGGVIISAVKVDSLKERPSVGSRVQIEGILQKNGAFITEIESEEDSEDQVELQGVLRGTSPDEKVWYVGGVPIVKPPDATPPPVGSSVKVAGTVENDSFVATKIEREEDDDDDEDEVKFSGTLVDVQPGQDNITVNIAGAKVSIDTSRAAIESNDGKPLKLSELDSLVGKNIKVSRPYMVDGVLHAEKVEVRVKREVKSSERDNEQHSDDKGDRKESDEEENHEDEDEDNDKKESDSRPRETMTLPPIYRERTLDYSRVGQPELPDGQRGETATDAEQGQSEHSNDDEEAESDEQDDSKEWGSRLRETPTPVPVYEDKTQDDADPEETRLPDDQRGETETDAEQGQSEHSSDGQDEGEEEGQSEHSNDEQDEGED